MNQQKDKIIQRKTKLFNKTNLFISYLHQQNIQINLIHLNKLHISIIDIKDNNQI